MADKYIGAHVTVRLRTGLQVTGFVGHIELSSHEMTLKEVQLEFPGQPPLYTPIYGVVGADIADLQVLAEAKREPSKSTDSSGSTAGGGGATKRKKQQSGNNNANRAAAEQRRADTRHAKSPVVPVKSASSNTKKSNRPRQMNGWEDEDVDGFKGKEFDFQANLDMFDKKKVFAEIQQSDETGLEGLLVTLNRLPRKETVTVKKSLLPTENVLDSTKESSGEESDTDTETSATSVEKLKKKQPKIRTVNGQSCCLTVSPLQMAYAEHECAKVTGPSEDQLIENGGRGASMVALQALGRRIKGSIVLVLAGNNKVGACGVAAARHLLNRGCHVVVCLGEQSSKLCKVVQRQVSMLKSFGGRVIDNVKELGQWPAMLVIDAVLGSQLRLNDYQEEGETYETLCSMIRWTRKQASPVLSIDFPSGVDGGTGKAPDPMHCVRPTWTVCLGAPKTGCLSSEVTGELFMVDLGIPKASWKRASAKGWTLPWGADFLVALEYVQ